MSTILYDSDFDLWIEQTIQQLKDRQFERLDVEHLIEELQDLGKSEKRALESNLMVLLAHLLKLKIQDDGPDAMTGSCYDSINEHRQRVQKKLARYSISQSLSVNSSFLSLSRRSQAGN
jgi:hypothetical protein